MDTETATIIRWMLLVLMTLGALGCVLYAFFLIRRTDAEDGGYLDTTEFLPPPPSNSEALA